ncbi:MAG: DUF72 domain-containing protein [Dehalococcoidia bacterium]|nr:DUF72 domain-containing protein [Dehalococcoidia bacterium]
MAHPAAEKVRVGTAGWTDPTLLKSGRFYPPEAKTPEQRLRFYASQFSIVEVDSSFYAMPSHDKALAWAARTSDDFQFDVKAFRIFTLHQTPLNLPKVLREDLEPRGNKAGNVYYSDLSDDEKAELWQIFKDALAPLRSANKLGYLLFQFPAWEFKNEHNLAVVRFHGRNADTWMKKTQTAAERFNYLYSEEEISELAERTRELASKTRQVHAMFNNCYEDKAQRNARQLIAMLAGR